MFDDDLAEFYGEFAETIIHKGNSFDVMFFDTREDIGGVYINHVYCTCPANDSSGMISGDTVYRGTIEYIIKSITDHSADKAIKIIELEFIRDAS